MADGDLIEIYVEVKASTANAILCYSGGADVWVPRSLIDEGESELDKNDAAKGDSGSISIPSWFAEKEGLV